MKGKVHFFIVLSIDITVKKKVAAIAIAPHDVVTNMGSFSLLPSLAVVTMSAVSLPMTAGGVSYVSAYRDIKQNSPSIFPARRGRCVSSLRGDGRYGSDMVEVVVANSSDGGDGAARGWRPRRLRE